MNEITETKSIFKSKTAFASAVTIVAGALGTYSPDVQKFLADNASTILLALGAANFALRLISRGRVVLFND